MTGLRNHKRDSHLSLMVWAAEGLPCSCSADWLKDTAGLWPRALWVSLKNLVKNILNVIMLFFNEQVSTDLSNYHLFSCLTVDMDLFLLLFRRIVWGMFTLIRPWTIKTWQETKERERDSHGTKIPSQNQIKLSRSQNCLNFLVHSIQDRNTHSYSLLYFCGTSI